MMMKPQVSAVARKVRVPKKTQAVA